MLIEYGFGLSAMREVARNRDNPAVLGGIVAGVTGAKVILTAVAVPAVFALQFFYTPLAHHESLLWAAFVWGAIQGFSFMWFFQGMETVKSMAVWEMSSRVVAAAGVLLFVRNTGDAPLVLLFQALAALIPVVAGYLMVRRHITIPAAWASHIIPSFRMGWSMFIYFGSVSLYTSANSLILGLYATPAQVGLYSGAERLVRAVQNLLSPLAKVFFARQSNLASKSHEEFVHMAQKLLVIMAGAGLCLTLGTMIGAPLWIKMLLGSGFSDSLPMMRVLSLLPFLIATGIGFGNQWLLPRGNDKLFNRVVLVAGALNILLAVLFVRRYSGMGMCIAVVLAESFIAVAFAVIAFRTGLFPKALERFGR